MSELTTQSLVEQIDSRTIEGMKIKGELVDLKKALQNYPEAQKIEELQERLNIISKEETELKELAKQKLISAGMKKFEALNGTIVQLNKKPGVLIIENEDIEALKDYKKEKITVSIDKKQLKEDIKEGLVIEGVSIKEDYTLVIKH